MSDTVEMPAPLFQRTYYRIDRTMPESRAWLPGTQHYQTLDSAQLDLADAVRFPLDRSYRIVKVIEEQIL